MEEQDRFRLLSERQLLAMSAFEPMAEVTQLEEE
jgi:hypothetical protein